MNIKQLATLSETSSAIRTAGVDAMLYANWLSEAPSSYSKLTDKEVIERIDGLLAMADVLLVPALGKLEELKTQLQANVDTKKQAAA